jgi:TonB family protein
MLLAAIGTSGRPTPDRMFPKPTSSELPMYPERARMAHVAGTVKLWFTLNGNGEVAQTKIISGNRLLSEAAVSTVKSWKFRPESIRPDLRYETEFVYVLSGQSKEGEPKLTVSMTDLRRVEVVSELYVVAIE